MILELQKRDPGKATYWELRSNYLDTIDRPRYDLTIIQNIELWMEYNEFEGSGIEYVVFDSKQLKYMEHSRADNLSLSRIKFYEKLIADHRAKKVAKFVNSGDQFGGDIEIFRLGLR